MKAIDLKEAGEKYQRAGKFEQALPLLLESVALRRYSHTLCISMSALAELYLDMLMLDEAERTAERMKTVAHRYDSDGQVRVANEIIRDVKEEREKGLRHGMIISVSAKHVGTDCLGVLRGKAENSYFVDVWKGRVRASRSQIDLCAERHSASAFFCSET